MAAPEGHEKIVSFLIEQEAENGLAEIEEKTTLDVATQKVYEIITQLLTYKPRIKSHLLFAGIISSPLSPR